MGAKKQWPGKEKLAITQLGLKGDCSVSDLFYVLADPRITLTGKR